MSTHYLQIPQHPPDIFFPTDPEFSKSLCNLPRLSRHYIPNADAYSSNQGNHTIYPLYPAQQASEKQTIKTPEQEVFSNGATSGEVLRKEGEL